ncbi:MAG: hypothetical protein CL578_05885 [Alteromonadaceae bacterium]|uniref:Uncharacterized protein n=1 Tax=Paraglaciecola agarilytica NO2 TaxID=1125747 RepID=A0ABQ0I225_9ALTE|nr:hypothetical protein [Paraglaciecola agarilytica]MBN24562.1 hypothetical protein [Alteromonadaceae bacterium]GAC03370.1 hypothetical protein GAGA_0505 [Paraglaciecola agarilytica NO2]|tara:strand:+ start:6367 stop:6777 length:411 start_codon:yes stop_codon:yes gene_type:complete
MGPEHIIHTLSTSAPKLVKTDDSYAYLYQGDWIAGGCALYAIGLLTLLGKSVRLLAFESSNRIEHITVAYMGHVADADGLHTIQAMKHKLLDEFGVRVTSTRSLTLKLLLQESELIDVSWDINEFSSFLGQHLKAE